jgi:heparosan-N-sulfate-glucuronate 5-epimerase
MRSYIERLSPRVGLYLRMASRYGQMIAGKSYAHRHQGLGMHFVPGRLSGYYSDLSHKTEWPDPVDRAGLPLDQSPGGEYIYHPIVILQKALGHWDRWLGSERRSVQHLASFLQIAGWALDSQDDKGGWEVWSLFGTTGALPYSAMAQGEAMSVLVRAFSTTGDDAYLEGARRALAPMLLPIKEGGTSWRASEGLVLEEIPFRAPETILNGWIFALYGLYDLTLVDDAQEAREALEATLSALLARLHMYDAGYWSFYDTSGTLASPFYHRLHIAQLEALELSYPDHAGRFRTLRETFQAQLTSRPNVARAVVIKSYQKLRNPPERLRP